MNYYKRGGVFGSLPPVTKNFLIINILMFAGTLLIQHMNISFDPSMLNLYNFTSDKFHPYQLITHMFMHAGLGHIFFNMFALFMFGRILESVWGSKRFFIFYIACGLGAALLDLTVRHIQLLHFYEMLNQYNANPNPQILWDIIEKYNINLNAAGRSLIQDWMDKPGNIKLMNEATRFLNHDVANALENTQTLGASGAIFGILAAFAVMFPNVELMLIFLPIPIKAKYMIPVYAIIELFLGVAHFKWDNVAHFAHLGGAIVGFILVMIWKRNRFRYQ
jgi:membrane associated rhomboid family serine protease